MRERLPHRRSCETATVEWQGANGSTRTYEVSVGYSDDGRPLEVFAVGQHEGSDTDVLLSDACVAVSLALQHGASPAELAKSMLKRPLDPLGRATLPASAVGAVVEMLAGER